MDILMIIIILGAFISKLSGGKKAAKQKEKKQAVPNQRRQPDRPMQRTMQTQTVSQTQKDANYYYQQQKNTKERLQQKYGLKQTYDLQNKTAQKSDILSRAKENVQENEQNVIQQKIHAEVCTDYRNSSPRTIDVEVHKIQSADCDTLEESDILKKVNDLMIMGYSGEIHFDRDFIAEGVDLLNRYSL